MYLSKALLLLLVGLADGWQAGRPRDGLVGFSFKLYDPACASACQGVFRKNPIFCTDEASFKMTGMSHGSSEMGGMDTPPNYTLTPSAACLATAKDFLTSEAWCVHEKCTGVPVWKLERWWKDYVVGNFESDPPPSLSYGAALALVSSTPAYTCTKGTNMNGTCLPHEKTWNARYIAIDKYNVVSAQHEYFGLVVFLSTIGIPIVFSLLRFAPFPRRWASKLNAYFIYPSLLRSWRKSLVGTVLDDPPTRGQALFISYMIVINLFLSCFTFKIYPEGYGYFYIDGPDQIMGNLSNRLGILSFANFGILVLFSSRNNVLLWVTDWKHSTFVLFHRWAGRLAILEAILHSVIFLRAYIVNGKLSTEQVLPYWWWGCIGTIAASLLLPLSVPIVRQRRYELFLITHIALSILVFLGSWYHIYFEYKHQSGYETWLYIVFAIWGFDRLMRPLRALRYGVLTASITPIDQDYIRIDVKGIVATGHVYLYFLHSRFWESHPFSVASSVVPQRDTSPEESDSSNADVNLEAGDTKSKSTVTCSLDRAGEPGMVFYLRTLDGGTKALRDRSRIKVLVEGSYGKHKDLSNYRTLICIAGGVGITACLPYLRLHPGNTRLYWGSRSEALVNSLKPLIQNFNPEIRIRQHLDLASILEEQGDDYAVVVSGPGSMMDEARDIVSRLARTKHITLVTESFSW